MASTRAASAAAFSAFSVSAFPGLGFAATIFAFKSAKESPLNCEAGNFWKREKKR